MTEIVRASERTHNWSGSVCSRCGAKRAVVELDATFEGSNDYSVRIARAALRVAPESTGLHGCKERSSHAYSTQEAPGKRFDLKEFLNNTGKGLPGQLSSTSLERAFKDAFQSWEVNAVLIGALRPVLGWYKTGWGTHHYHIVAKPIASAAARAIVALGGYEHADVLAKLIERDPPHRDSHIFEMLDRAIEYKLGGFDFDVSPLDRHWNGDRYSLRYRLCRGSALYFGSNSAKSGSWTGLHFLIREGDNQFSQLLLANLVHVNDRDANGSTPLHIAVIHQHRTDEMRLLLSNGADVDARENLGRTPLHNAVVYDNVPVAHIDLLLEKGANINARDNNGRTPLHLAMHPSTNRIPEVLLRLGADVNARDKDGQTCLGYKVRMGEDRGYHADLLRRYGGVE